MIAFDVPQAHQKNYRCNLSLRSNKNSLLSFVDAHIIDYPTPINLNYMWSFGSTAGLCLVIQNSIYSGYSGWLLSSFRVRQAKGSLFHNVLTKIQLLLLYH